MAFQRFDEVDQASRKKEIVAVEPTHLRRTTLGNAFVDRRRLSAVRIAAPARDPILPLADDLGRSIGRPLVGNKHLDRQLELKDRRKGVFQIATLLVGRDSNGNKWLNSYRDNPYATPTGLRDIFALGP